jgi:hypothetical protein
MDETRRFMVDPVWGIEARAIETPDGLGWKAQWRPSRAIKNFPSFSYRERQERFATAGEALDFITVHAQRIAAGKI